METIGTPLMWAVFTAFVILALIVDLLVLRLNGPAVPDTVRRNAWCEVQGIGERVPVSNALGWLGETHARW